MNEQTEQDSALECSSGFQVDPPLVCHLGEGHAGLHWDGQENLSWKAGRPDE